MDPSRSDAGARLSAQVPRLRLVCAHLAGRAIRARVELEDLVQEVLLRALAHPGGLPPAAPGSEAGDADLARFLAVIARHTVVDLARGLRAQKRAGIQGEVRLSWSSSGPEGLRESRIAVRGSGPVSHLERAELRDDLVGSFLELEPDHRRVIGLRQLEGLTAAEAGKRMARGEAAVHSLFRRALLAWEEKMRARARGGSPAPPAQDSRDCATNRAPPGA